ncbi:hypothetical protein ACA910_005905 [Epithemia clementina (nom. ined.)]
MLVTLGDCQLELRVETSAARYTKDHAAQLSQQFVCLFHTDTLSVYYCAKDGEELFLPVRWELQCAGQGINFPAKYLLAGGPARVAFIQLAYRNWLLSAWVVGCVVWTENFVVEVQHLSLKTVETRR